MTPGKGAESREVEYKVSGRFIINNWKVDPSK